MNDWMKLDPSAIEEVARRELRDEQHRAAVERRKAQLREQKNKSLWQRLIDKLPFTITWKRKVK